MAVELTEAIADRIVADNAAGKVQQMAHVERRDPSGEAFYLIDVRYHDGTSMVVKAEWSAAGALLLRVRNAHCEAEAAAVPRPQVRNRCDACALWAPLFLVEGKAVCLDCKGSFEKEGYLMFLDNETGEMVTIEKERKEAA